MIAVGDEMVDALTAAFERIVEEQLGELADDLVGRLVEALTEVLAPSVRPRRRPDAARPLVGVAEVARYLGASEPWVRRNAKQLKVRRLSADSRATMRFDLRDVDEVLLAGGDARD